MSDETSPSIYFNFNEAINVCPDGLDTRVHRIWAVLIGRYGE